ncbi:response regulator [Phenylobacterium sp.]|jgi:CheY-like chemotaxis protein|uniref:response regulator n=1 Tax=Phenylobacterium sp. TaxID=1871053 RepID=UPI002E371778|nr:response regulator [Phenylobacterium sp.]HEX3363510.1 response regulator [Phenylobacterium sp.]
MSETHGPRLLYVEDEPLIQELAVTALEEAGFSLDTVSSGAAAIAAIDERGVDFKALITDIDLGTGPSGWDVAKHARERFPDLPIVYVGGGSSNDWPSLGVPGSIMLVKPYASAQLIVAVSTAMLPADGR